MLLGFNILYILFIPVKKDFKSLVFICVHQTLSAFIYPFGFKHSVSIDTHQTIR